MTVRTALTFRASSIGDGLMGKYLLENVHAAFPEARLGLVVGSRAGMLKDLFAAYPWLEVMEANRRHPRSIRGLFARFGGSDFTVTQYAGKGGSFSLPSKVIGRLLTKRNGFVGFTDPFWGNRFLYDALVPLQKYAAPASLERAALSARGIPVATEKLTLEHLPQQGVAERLGITTPFVLVHLFAGNASRGIDGTKKQALVQALAAALGDTRLVLTGSAQERAEAAAAAEGTPQAQVIAGDVTLQELMSLMTESAGVITVDTGVAHIAAHLGTPLVVLRTCLGAQWWKPEQYGAAAPITVLAHDEACAAGHVFRDYPACIDAIAPEEAVAAARTQFHV